MKGIRHFIFYWLPPLIVMVIIFALSSRQRISIADTYVENFAIFKSLHVLEYSLLFFLIFRALFSSFKKMKLQHIFILSIVSTILYAISDELHQTFTPTRQGSVRDVFIDTIGILITFSYTKKYLAKLKWIL